MADFEQWRSSAIERLFDSLKSAAEARAKDFFAHTGLELELAYPIAPRVTLPNDGPEVRFMKLGLGSALVHIYTSHMPGSLTHIHLLPSRTTSLRNNERLVSEPGAFIVRTAHDGFELRFQRGDPEGRPSQVMPLDTLVFRTFRLLVAWSSDP